MQAIAFSGLADRRLDRVFTKLVGRAADRGVLTIRRLANRRCEEVQFGRFLCNARVTFPEMIDAAIPAVAAQTQGRSVLLVEDTIEVSFGYEPFQTGLAPVGNGQESGFFLHPLIALDADEELCLGLAALEVFRRTEGPKPPRHQVPLAERPSARWLRTAEAAKAACPRARQHTVITDREGDTYYVLSGYRASGLDFVVRCWHNRRLATPSAEADTLGQRLATWPIAGAYRQKLPPTDKRNAHEALLHVKFGALTLQRPLPNRKTMQDLPAELPLYVVEVCEDPSTVVGKQAPVHWILLTSHPVTTLEQARQIIRWYARRWSIEEVFRLLKKQGLELPAAEQHTVESLTKLAVVGLLAAVRVLQLVTGRAATAAASTLAFNATEIHVLQTLSPTLEGASALQKNPHPSHSLAFAAWVIARLGGWKGYPSERPPGPVTMYHGLQRFQTYVEAFLIFAKLKDT